jgi:hypothetical protein
VSIVTSTVAFVGANEGM